MASAGRPEWGTGDASQREPSHRTARLVPPRASAGNQAAPPLFVDAAAGDYREAAGSPTRGAGEAAVVLSGETDLAGGARITDCDGISGVDIGAYQVQCSAPPAPSAPPVTTISNVAPILSKLSLTHKRFAVAGTKVPKGTPHGTGVGFRLSEPARVTLSILAKRARPGKKPRLVTLGKLQASGRAGKNQVPFSGKLKGKPLAPGRYKLQVVAKDSAGLSSNALGLPFQIVG